MQQFGLGYDIYEVWVTLHQLINRSKSSIETLHQVNIGQIGVVQHVEVELLVYIFATNWPTGEGDVILQLCKMHSLG